MSETIIDVAIVGGGISGIYTGWRLLTADLTQYITERGRGARCPPLRAERPDRRAGDLAGSPGDGRHQGRIRRDALPDQPAPGQRADRSVGTGHPAVSVSGDENIYYIRGQHLRGRDFVDPDESPLPSELARTGENPRGAHHGGDRHPHPRGGQSHPGAVAGCERELQLSRPPPVGARLLEPAARSDEQRGFQTAAGRRRLQHHHDQLERGRSHPLVPGRFWAGSPIPHGE